MIFSRKYTTNWPGNSKRTICTSASRTFGKVDITTKQEDSVERSNKPTKEFQKFLLAFEVVEALPAEYDKVGEDLEISISSYIFKPEKFFDKWTDEADTNATAKGRFMGRS